MTPDDTYQAAYEVHREHELALAAESVEEAILIERWAKERAYVEALLDDPRAKFLVLFDDGELVAA